MKSSFFLKQSVKRGGRALGGLLAILISGVLGLDAVGLQALAAAPNEESPSPALDSSPTGLDLQSISEQVNAQFQKRMKEQMTAFRNLIDLLNELPDVSTLQNKVTFEAQKASLESSLQRLGLLERILCNPGQEYQRLLAPHHLDEPSVQKIAGEVNERYAATNQAQQVFVRIREQCTVVQNLMRFADQNRTGWQVSPDRAQILFTDQDLQRRYRELDAEVRRSQRGLHEAIRLWDAALWKGGVAETNAPPKTRKRTLH